MSKHETDVPEKDQKKDKNKEMEKARGNTKWKAEKAGRK